MDVNDTLLLVIDVQGKLVTLMHDRESLFRNLERLIKLSEILNIPVVWSEQAPDKIGATVDSIARLLSPRTQPVAKRTFSCYGSAQLRSQIDGLHRRHVLIAGIETHVCIYQTARDLSTHGYTVDLVVDAVSSRSLVNTETALTRLRRQGVGVTTVEMAACDLIHGADHPKFREVMAYIK